MNTLSFLLLLFAFCGAVRMPGHRLHGFAMAWWAFSWLGQCLALPLAVASASMLALNIAADVPRPFADFACLGSLALYLYMHARNHWMGRELQHVVGTEIAPASEPAPVPLLAGFNPFAMRKPGVERIADIDYGDHGVRSRLDIYRPANHGGAGLPVLIQIHGGAWILGNKEQQGLPLMYHLAARGWLCVAINYRLGPRDRFPAMLVDVLRAVAWVRQHAAEYGGDAGFIALTGGSAGGHLAALAALVPNRAGLQDGFEQVDTTVDAVIPMYGRYDFLDRRGVWGAISRMLNEFKATRVMPGPVDQCRPLWELASPIAQVHAQAPPFFVVHGTHDCLIAVEEARHFVEELRAVSAADVLYAELHGAQHAFDLVATPATEGFVYAAELFLRTQLARKQAREAAGNDASASRGAA